MFNLKINNFKSLVNSEFEFEKVNILIGENSSGKSSLIKFLLLLDRSFTLYNKSFHFSNDLGRYSDFVYNHNTDLPISFQFTLGKEYTEYFLNQNEDDDEYSTICEEVSLLKDEFKEVELKFTFDKNVNIEDQVIIEISDKYFGSLVLIRHKEEKGDLLRDKCCSLKYIDKENREFLLDEVSYDQHGFFTILHGKTLKEYISEHFPDDDYIFFEIAYLLIAQNFMRAEFYRLRYINPLDSVPERSYSENEGEGGIYPVKNIKDVVNILTDETIEQDARDHLLETVNSVLREYGIIWELKVDSKGYDSKMLMVKLSENGIWNNIKDVGYGTALQIPILFQAILGDINEGEIIIIEQPETHVHPHLQSKFIEVLLSIGKKNTFIIETHSEDIIRKLQVMVKKSEFNLISNDIKIYYFNKLENNVSNPSLHTINEHGKLTPSFPTGFYDSSSNLVKELF